MKRKMKSLISVTLMGIMGIIFVISVSASSGVGNDSDDFSSGGANAHIWSYCSLGTTEPIGCIAETEADKIASLRLAISYCYSNGVTDSDSAGWVKDFYLPVWGKDAMGTAYVGSTHYVNTEYRFLFADARNK